MFLQGLKYITFSMCENASKQTNKTEAVIMSLHDHSGLNSQTTHTHIAVFAVQSKVTVDTNLLILEKSDVITNKYGQSKLE